MNAISCESCHIPRIYAFARQHYDWTVIRPDGEARMECRGIEGDKPALDVLATGYDPVLLARNEVDGQTKLAPHNLVTSWYWVYGDPPRPVPKRDLEAVWLDGTQYHIDILEVFDKNGDNELDDSELIIDTENKEIFITARLEELGLDSPRIYGEIQPYSINHTVATGEWAIKDCEICHSAESKLGQPIELAAYIPGNVMPEFVSDSNVSTNGEIYIDDGGRLNYKPATAEEGLYILGHDKVQWVDVLGILILIGTLLGVLIHGGMRIWSAMRRPKHEPQLKRVYMYSVYERLWHWLQTFVIFGLILSGLIIHKPETLGFLSFRGVVLVHNVLAAILVINAALALFYHLASGEIRQYLPRPRGFFDQAITQAKYYIRDIFKGGEHPYEKTPEKKLNPLQQITYFGLLNVLLPLQIITGALIWGAQRWPDLSASLGGLRYLSPFHTLITWLLAAFIIAHVYLTTTGHTPTAAIKAMMNGWDEVEVHVAPAEEVEESDDDNSIPDTEQAQNS
jgi:thiosulfate reductase cytochrome b subunit